MRNDTCDRTRSRAALALLTTIALLTLAPARSDRAISPQAETGTPSRGRPSETIAVHGHWTIEIRNPDGRLASRHEFENGLHGFGALTLPKVLARLNSIGRWGILLDGNPAPCRLIGNPNAFFCHVFEPPDPHHDGTANFATLAVTVPDTGVNAGKLVFSGNLTAAADGNINSVATSSLICPPDVAPSMPCDANTAVGGLSTSELFTDRFLQSPIQVVAGQLIQVTVVISFS